MLTSMLCDSDAVFSALYTFCPFCVSGSSEICVEFILFFFFFFPIASV